MVDNFGIFIYKLFEIFQTLGQYLYNFLTMNISDFILTIPKISEVFDIIIIGDILQGIVGVIGKIFPYPILSIQGMLEFVGIGIAFVIIKHFI